MKCVGVMVALGMAVCPGVAPGAFQPGRFYTPADNGRIFEFDPNLQLTGQILVPGVETATGAVFNSAGNLVFIGRRNGFTRVMEVNGSGTIVREYNTGNGTLLRGSYIDFDPVLQRYAFADDRKITLLDSNLSLVASTPEIFNRASGVAFAADGTIVATDQFSSTVRRFTPTLGALPSIDVPANVLTGIEVAGDGDLLFAVFGGGQVLRRDSVTGVVSTVISNQGSGGISDVIQVPGGDLITIGTNARLRRFTEAGAPLQAGQSANEFADGVAYLVPGPGCSWLILLTGAGLLRRRERRSGG